MIYGETSASSTSVSSASSGAMMAGLSITIALGIMLFAFSYKRYHTRKRARLLQQQVAMLEAMWRMSSRK